MSKSFRLTVWGQPVPWTRAGEGHDPRSGRRWRRTPEKMRAYQNEIKMTWVGVGRPKLEGPIALEVSAYVARPQGHYGTGRNAGKLKPSAPQHVLTTPDSDNYLKQVCDALNLLAWQDDKLITRLAASKKYADRTPPQLVIQARELEDDE